MARKKKVEVADIPAEVWAEVGPQMLRALLFCRSVIEANHPVELSEHLALTDAVAVINRFNSEVSRAGYTL